MEVYEYEMDEFVQTFSEMSIYDMAGEMLYILLLGIGTGIIVGLLLYAVCVVWNTVKSIINW